MNMQHRIYAGVTVVVTKLNDLYEAVALVEGAEVVHTATDKFSGRQRPAGRRQLNRQPRQPRRVIAKPKAEPRVKPSSVQRKSKRHSVASSDPRAVFRCEDGHNTVVDVKATLRNMGLTAKQLEDMPTKQGTLEYTVKRSMVLNRLYARRKMAEAKANLGNDADAKEVSS